MPFRVGLAGSNPIINHREMDIHRRASCNLASGDLYVFPNSTSVVDATQPVTFQWNTACPVGTTTVDLYLYEPSSTTGLIHAWTGVTFADGKYTATLLPKWWNDTTTATLQLSIIDGGGMSWMTSSPAGPPFSITYPASAMYSTTSGATATNAAAATQSADAIFQNVSSSASSGGISKGAIAAAVVVPLLVLAIIAAVAIRFYRIREADKRKRWSAAISTHSGLDWQDGALGHEKPASIYSRQGRPSDVNSNNRTSSMFAAENNFAGAGAGVRPAYNLRTHSSPDVNGEMIQVRPSSVFTGPIGTERQSRISFAEAARPDRRSRLSLGESLHARPTSIFSGLGKHAGASKSTTDIVTPSKKSLAYATGSAIEDEDEMNISPSQLQGPDGFADAEMRRVGNARRTGRRSILSLGKDARRDSTASALSTDDFKSAASARGSVDELRDIESVMLHRRSMMSQHSATSPASVYVPQMEDNNQLESLSLDAALAAKYSTSKVTINGQQTTISTPLPAVIPMPAPPSPILGAENVQTQDRMLSVYSTRAKTNAVPAPNLGPKSSIKYLPSGSSSSTANNLMPPPPVPVTSGAAPLVMKSLVHLNNGAVSPAALGIKTVPTAPQVNQIQYIDVGPSSDPSAAATPTPASGSRMALGLRIPSFNKRSGSSTSIPQVQDRGSVQSNAASDGSRYSVNEESHAK